MATLKQLLTVLTITTVCITPLFAQGQNNCDPNCLHLQDGSCDQECLQDGTCDGTGSQRRGGHGRRGGRGNGRGHGAGQGQNGTQTCDPNHIRLQDGTCDQECLQDGTCDGTGSQKHGRQGRRGGRGHGRGRSAGQGFNGLLSGEIVPLTAAEILSVEQMRQEEKLARDVYLTLNETWSSDVFARIAASEQRHMDAVAKVITLQDMEDPITDDTMGSYRDQDFVNLYTSLTDQGSPSYVEALKVGAYIEELDIVDLENSLLEVTNPQLTRVYSNLLRGSRNHLRAFVSALATEDESYSPQIMSQEDYDLIINAAQERGNGRMRRGAASTN